MSEADARSSVNEGTEQTKELVNQGRREALTRFAKYTAPAMLAVLMSTTEGKASTVVSVR